VSRRRTIVCAACPGRAVELVTARALAAGDALTLDYGARPLRALLQGYAFVPADAAFASPSEVRPAPSAPCGPGTCDAWASERRAADPRALLPTRAFIHGALLAQQGPRAAGECAGRAVPGEQRCNAAARAPGVPGRHRIAMGGAHCARLCPGAAARQRPPRVAQRHGALGSVHMVTTGSCRPCRLRPCSVPRWLPVCVWACAET
jgi:hypothetical protein